MLALKSNHGNYFLNWVEFSLQIIQNAHETTSLFPVPSEWDWVTALVCSKLAIVNSWLHPLIIRRLDANGMTRKSSHTAHTYHSTATNTYIYIYHREFSALIYSIKPQPEFNGVSCSASIGWNFVSIWFLQLVISCFISFRHLVKPSRKQ